MQILDTSTTGQCPPPRCNISIESTRERERERERERINQNRLCLDPSPSTHTIVAPPLNMPLFPAQLMELRIAQQKAKTVRMAMYGAAGAAMLGAAVAMVAGGRAPVQLGGWRR